MEKYIHYGSERFDPEKFMPICNFTVKPRGGLWASRIDDKYGWYEWCHREEFRLNTFKKYFEFTLAESAKVLFLDDPKQLKNLPKIEMRHSLWKENFLDFEELSKKYDAIEVTDIGPLYRALYGWDCNSIVIMNPNVIMPV